MIHFTCDVCGTPIEHPAVRTIFETGRYKTQVIHCIDNVWNKGHICIPCLKSLVADGKAR